MKLLRKTGAAALLLALVLLLAGCSAGSSDNSAFDTGGSGSNGAGGWSDSAATEEEGVSDDGEAALQDGPKKIYTGYIEAETTDFAAAQQSLADMVAEAEGYFSNRSVSNHGAYRYGDYTIRVPAARFQGFLSQVGEGLHVTYQTDSEEDVSEAYYDIAGRLATQRTKLERLQTLLSQAESMADIITIEDAISETEWMIEDLSGSLQSYDNRIDYATVTVSLREVYRLSGSEAPVTTLGGRLKEAFTGGLRNVGSVLEELAVWLVYNWVWLALLAAMAAGAAALIRRRKKRRQPPGGGKEGQ